MDSPNTPCSMNSHQAIMKCPWQWRQPFLDEKLESRKRKVGDGYFYDPVDPNFVDHLLPGYAKKFCANLLESDEKEKIQLEIQRLMLKKEEQADRMFYDALFFGGGNASKKSSSALSSDDENTDEEDAAASTSAALLLSPAQSSSSTSSSDDDDESETDVSQENMALVDSILLMTKSVDESSLLASPKSVSSPLSPLLDDDEDEEHCLSLNSSTSSDEQCFEEPLYERSSSLELVSDNLQDNYFASEDSDLLDFPTSSD